MAAAEEGFLTDHQREIFNAVTQEREPQKEITGPRPHIEHATKHPPAVSRHHHVVANKQERRSHSVKSGRPKKGGGGGRGTWGNPLEPYTDYDNSDPHDPNYDDGAEHFELAGGPVAESVEEYKARVVALVDEYFASGDVAAAAADLRELGSPSYHHYFLKKLVSLALDRHDREKEMAAALLSALYADVVQPEQMPKGFLQLLTSADDLELDCPRAVEVLALFLARAIVDDILPPAFLAKARAALPEGAQGLRVLQLAEANLGTPHHAERVERAWGGTGRDTVAGTKARIARLLKELLASGDAAEAGRCIRELNLPFYHHEVVKQALTMAMEAKGNGQSHLLGLLRKAADEGLISSSQMTKGLSRLLDNMDDLVLDIPGARESLQAYVTQGIEEGWVSPEVKARMEEAATEGGPNPEEGKTIQNFKRKSVAIVLEYFESGDVAEVSRSLEELAFPDLLHLFMKKIVTLAMDRKLQEKEMASGLLSSLYPEVLPSDQVEAAFTNLLESVEDLALDIPDAAYELALFLARAVVDDILAPLYLANAREVFKDGSLAAEVVHGAQSMLAARHAGERILRCWGGTAGRTVEDAKEKIARLLEEYAAGGDLAEACQCIRDLNLPFFHHEIVKKAVVMAMEKQRESLLDLLRECASENLINTTQMAKGLSRVREALPDLSLDIPDARDTFSLYLERGKREGWISSGSKTPSVEASGDVVSGAATATATD